MQSGLYVALSGQVALDHRLTTIAANVANQGTPGYRAEEVDFKTMLSRTGPKPVAYVSPGTTYLSTRHGVPIKTDNPLDVTVQGDGWLALKAPSGTVYTRDGRMRMEPNGALVSVNGYPVLDAGNAPLQLDPDGGPVSVAQDGMITQNLQQIGAIGLFSLDGAGKLRRYDNSSVVPDGSATQVLDFAHNGVSQGYVEGANVDPIQEIAKLIAVTRTYEFIGSALEGSESSLKDAIRILGSPA
jgi:flagellar basal-body rod protein FlgF